MPPANSDLCRLSVIANFFPSHRLCGISFVSRGPSRRTELITLVSVLKVVPLPPREKGRGVLNPRETRQNVLSRRNFFFPPLRARHDKSRVVIISRRDATKTRQRNVCSFSLRQSSRGLEQIESK